MKYYIKEVLSGRLHGPTKALPAFVPIPGDGGILATELLDVINVFSAFIKAGIGGIREIDEETYLALACSQTVNEVTKSMIKARAKGQHCSGGDGSWRGPLSLLPPPASNRTLFEQIWKP